MTPFFLALTFLGEATFFLVFLPLGYWLWNHQTFFRLTMLLFVSAFLNSILKDLFQVPRPDIVHLIEVDGWSFPSGHAQIAATIWPWLALELRRAKLPPALSFLSRNGGLAMAAFLVVGVASSRVYLGVHRPIDVVTGIAVGLTLVALTWWIIESPLASISPWKQSPLVFGFLVAGYASLWGDIDSVSIIAGGALLGSWVGALCQQRHFDMEQPRGMSRVLGVVVLGLAGAFGLRWTLKALFGAADWDGPPIDFMRYAAIGAWLTYLGPWFFQAVGLTTTDRPEQM